MFICNNFLLFLDISGGELIIVVIAVLVIFGPKKIPEIARKIGRITGEIRKVTDDLKGEIQSGIHNIEKEIDVDKIKKKIEITKEEIDIDNKSIPTDKNE